MADFTALKTAIQNAIKQNGNNAITGNLLQDILISMVSTLGDSAINGLSSSLSTETTNRQNADGTLQSAINTINTKLSDGYTYLGIATSTTTPSTTSGKVFYIATTAGTYTHFGSLTVTAGINILKYNGSAWSVDQAIAIDAEPTAGSNNLVKSGGVQNELALGAVYDVSAKNPTAGPNNDGKWESLSALLSDANLNTLIPTSVRKGGMSIKYVCSSDNKYVQFRYMSSAVTGTPNPFIETKNWQGVDDKVSENLKNIADNSAVINAVAELGLTPSTELVVNLIDDGIKLKGGNDGYCVEDNDYELCKYNIIPGWVLKLNISKDSDGVMQFQNNAAVPTSGGNTHLIGSVYETVVNGMVKVPEGATWLIVSQLKSNNTNTVEKLVDIDEVPLFLSKNIVKSGGVEKKLQEIRQKSFLVSSSGNMTAGNTFEGCLLYVNIKAGETFDVQTIVAPSVTVKTQYIYATSNPTDFSRTNLIATIYGNVKNTITAQADIDYLFVYEAGNNIIGSGIISVEVINHNSLEYKVNEVEKDTENINDTILYPLSKTSPAVANTTFNGCLINANIQIGDSFKIKLSLPDITSHKIVSIYGSEDGSFTRDRLITQLYCGNEVTVTATDNYKYIFANVQKSSNVTGGNLTMTYTNLKGLYGRTELLEEKIPVKWSPDLIGVHQDVDALDANNSADAVMGYLCKSVEDTIVNTMSARVAELNSTRKFNLALITDTHFGGTYMLQHRSPLRSLELFNRLCANQYVDACVHCGDLSTDYGAAKEHYMLWMNLLMDKLSASSLIVAKGNHDYNKNDYVEAYKPYIDFSKNTYYVWRKTSVSNFDQISEQDWDGVTQLYVKAGDTRYITDSEFSKIAQKLTPLGAQFDENYPDRAYFYVDYDNAKIRVITLNNYMVNNSQVYDNSEDLGNQFKWLSQIAFDFSDKQVPSDWAVVIVQHISFNSYLADNKTAALAIINAYKNGTAVTGSLGGVAYDMDFTSQGAGTFICALHGHEHQYKFETDNGFNDIGFNYPIVPNSEFGNAASYVGDIVTIDRTNRTIYNICANHEERVFSY